MAVVNCFRCRSRMRQEHRIHALLHRQPKLSDRAVDAIRGVNHRSRFCPDCARFLSGLGINVAKLSYVYKLRKKRYQKILDAETKKQKERDIPDHLQ